MSRIGAILILDDLAPSLNMAGHNKKSFSFRQADGLTNFNLIWLHQKNLLFYYKKSASVRQPLGIHILNPFH